MKKMLAISMSLIMAASLAGCSSGGGAGKSTQPQTAQENAGDKAPGEPTSGKKRTIQLGHIDPAQDVDPYHTLAMNFKTEIEELSGGAITIDVITDAQLGSELSMIEGMNMGTIDMAVITNFSFSSSVPDFAVFDLPYLFMNREQAHAVLDDTSITDAMEEELYNDFGVKILSWGEGGFRSTINKKRPINTPADLKGIKIRVPENSTYVDTFKALGANPTTMASSECFTALQQGTIDGLEQPVTPMYTYKSYELCDYISFTEHFYSPITLSVSKFIWDDLSDEEKGWFEEAAKKAAEEERASAKETDDKLLKEMEEAGVQVNEVADKQQFRDAVKPIHEAFAADVNKELLDKINEKIAEIQ